MASIRIETDRRGVARLVLAKPERHNAMGAETIAGLHEAARALGADAGVRAVVLTGEGRSFCAGADLEWMRRQFAASREERMAEARRLAGMLRTLNEIPKPLIGRIGGAAYGGGLGLMAVCDVAVGALGARFAFTETRLGIIPATIAPFVVAKMGEGRAREVFASGRPFDAEEAVRLGLLARAVPAEDLDAAVEREVEPYLLADGEAVARAKRLARSLGPVIDETVGERTAALLADAWESPAARERIGAFLAKARVR